MNGVPASSHGRRRGVELPLIGLEDFKTNKGASGRLEELADLEALDPPPEE